MDADDEEKASDHDEQSSHLVGNGSVDKTGRLADRTKTGGWKAAAVISGTELAERVGYLGVQHNIVLFFTKGMHVGNVNAANMVSNFMGAVSLTPFIGGYVADALLGRFWAIVLFGLIQVTGLVLLTLTAALPALKPSACPVDTNVPCRPAHGGQLAILYIAIYLIALGNAGFKTNISSIGADQFDELDPKEEKQISHFFNWYQFCSSIGTLISITIVVYLEDNIGFGWGYGISTAVFLVSIMIFIGGAPVYRFKRPSGSPLTSIAQVLVSALRNRNLPLPADENLLHENFTENDTGSAGMQKIIHSNHLTILDKAAIVRRRPAAAADGKDSSALPSAAQDVNPWEQCTVTQVEEVKMIIRLLPIWASTVFVWTVLAQMQTFSVEAAATVDRHIGPKFQFPAASLAVFDSISALFLLPLYDIFLVPLMRRYTGKLQGITNLQRMGVGLVVSVLTMVVAGVVEMKRVNAAKYHGLLDEPKKVIPISVFWFAPQYFLLCVTGIFFQVGQLDFFYSEAPESMRSLGTAMYLSTTGVGHFESTLLVSLVKRVTRHGGNDPGWLTGNLNGSRLYKFYYLLATMGAVNSSSTWPAPVGTNTRLRSLVSMSPSHDEYNDMHSAD